MRTPGFEWQATQILLNDPDLDHEYLGILGLPEYTSAAARLMLGGESAALSSSRVVRSVTPEPMRSNLSLTELGLN